MYVCPVYPFSICFKGFSLWLYFVSVRCWGFTVIQELHTHVLVTHTYVYILLKDPYFYINLYTCISYSFFKFILFCIYFLSKKNSYWCGKPFGYTMYVYDCILASFVCNFLFLIFLFSIRFVFRLFSFSKVFLPYVYKYVDIWVSYSI